MVSHQHLPSCVFPPVCRSGAASGCARTRASAVTRSAWAAALCPTTTGPVPPASTTITRAAAWRTVRSARTSLRAGAASPRTFCSKVHLPDYDRFVIHGGECMSDCPTRLTRDENRRYQLLNFHILKVWLLNGSNFSKKFVNRTVKNQCTFVIVSSYFCLDNLKCIRFYFMCFSLIVQHESEAFYFEYILNILRW